MQRVWRSPLLAAGVVLLFLGLGNWLVSWNKVAEYSHRVRSDSAPREEHAVADFPALNQGTSATLLEHLNSGNRDYSAAQAKLDFYRVVESGGRLLAVSGLLLITLALLRSWRWRGGAAEP